MKNFDKIVFKKKSLMINVAYSYSLCDFLDEEIVTVRVGVEDQYPLYFEEPFEKIFLEQETADLLKKNFLFLKSVVSLAKEIVDCNKQLAKKLVLNYGL